MKKQCVGCQRQSADAVDAGQWGEIAVQLSVMGQHLDTFKGAICSPGCIAVAMRNFAETAEKSAREASGVPS